MKEIEQVETMNCILQHCVGIGFENQSAVPDLPKNLEKPAIPPSLPSYYSCISSLDSMSTPKSTGEAMVDHNWQQTLE